jgi:hypothetical protein
MKPVAVRVCTVEEVGQLRALIREHMTACGPAASIEDAAVDGQVGVVLYDHGPVGGGNVHVELQYVTPAEARRLIEANS